MPEPGETPATAPDAPVIVSEPGSFAHGVLTERHPALIEKVRAAFPYGPGRRRALDALAREITGAIEPLGPDAADRDRWQRWGAPYIGRSWLDVPFLWAEAYFYRKLLGAVGYFDEGPWQGIDPFRPFKEAELGTTEAREELAALDGLATRPPAEQDAALLHGALWGNRADLGFRISAGDRAAAEDTALVADDSAALWSLLPAGARATVHLVADNAGRELVPDLLLVDHLLRRHRADRVVLHVKPRPYYVSDATMADTLDCLRHCGAAGGAAAEAARRLRDALRRGRLDVSAHPFFCSPLTYEEMPGDLRERFAGATVTVLKGDLNYRRLVGDRHWPPTTSFTDRTAYFPSPVAALRILKSDVIVGLGPRTEASLVAARGQRWRTSGEHALIQVRH
ncbi:hypothetical protein GCM10018793_30890 [Streptomyces sulfonofaciens]|uniref:Damage-control phosphatase ARMT1-like metal-binding domain-containing protein n=1 Tax=Streptomyces sulfonofaciens TaxID=68272 RepID=A0A919G7Y1_9ACTN|nr:damage-control phosphatase ARMT1 family protein [Streptomyces sulfonofaciens]GHH79081.1 hypothetical protein GCM10018793_30890 [Streptomyces sulfonofaciens]